VCRRVGGVKRESGTGMSNAEPLKCVEPVAGVLPAPGAGKTTERAASAAQEERTVQATVGKEAPDFQARAFVEGGFQNVTLSQFKGQWIMLCFYPGDFTFV
jgi:hypothetical protein